MSLCIQCSLSFRIDFELIYYRHMYNSHVTMYDKGPWRTPLHCNSTIKRNWRKTNFAICNFQYQNAIFLILLGFLCVLFDFFPIFFEDDAVRGRRSNNNNKITLTSLCNWLVFRIFFVFLLKRRRNSHHSKIIKNH